MVDGRRPSWLLHREGSKASAAPRRPAGISIEPFGMVSAGQRSETRPFFSRQYRGQAEAIRPFIKYQGYLNKNYEMVGCNGCRTVFGKNAIALTCSEPIRTEIQRYFGYNANVGGTRSISIISARSIQSFVENDLSSSSGPVGLFVGER